MTVMTLSSVIIVICLPRDYTNIIYKKISYQELKEGRKETESFMAGKSGFHAMKVEVSRQETQRVRKARKKAAQGHHKCW